MRRHNQSMSDSENWSSFENKQEKVAKQETHGEIDDRKFEARIFRNQLIFGSIVGFTSGATFATGILYNIQCNLLEDVVTFSLV